MTATVQTLNRLLPQTQCRECGYNGCLPYAEALISGEAAVNLCAPGGEAVMRDIAGILGKPECTPAKIQTKALAWIDESACIGCTACIRACPVDAIMGAHKLMHTVIRNECTGCGLCVAPCPVDCIHMQPVETDFLPQARHLAASDNPRFAAAEHALRRYEWQTARKQRDTAERKAMLAEREAATKAKQQTASATEHPAKPAFNPMDLIAKAMSKAQTQQERLVTSANRETFKSRQLEEAKQRAEYRRAQRDIKYGNEAEKAAALVFLRRYKAEQEALKEAKEAEKTQASK
ncbi:RnfABCDGE type electron transport complex subunit B [Neisseria animalis]|uniref:RnfABCDGE type electron transport complex subunit B n=1 Tax=Neisseria animalis TaxID=492 RepID=A0A5P3MRG2_NEIAN|nr:RnfABCDGE type electron transport complex subunit B [Neisseria animalis]QEY23371.1 RnfABCDGE type electron transport complex subunit B [Neisseria animalis]ROW33216.1 RnfABCDGE type electron transport complex subunit B [Neisseria animalis]VEE08781.1 ferredoxin [Neisseria animalis]